MENDQEHKLYISKFSDLNIDVKIKIWSQKITWLISMKRSNKIMINWIFEDYWIFGINSLGYHDNHKGYHDLTVHESPYFNSMVGFIIDPKDGLDLVRIGQLDIISLTWSSMKKLI